MADKLVSATEGCELKEKVKLLEAVIQNLFQNVIRLDKEISELKTKTKSKNITEKTSDEHKLTDTVNSSKEKCKSKQENIVKEAGTSKEVIISKPSAVEVKTDNTEQHANLQSDVCEYTCKKKNTMEKHMNIKHNSNHIAKECSMMNTSD